MSHQKLGRYELIRVVGKGAMGQVYEGRDPNLDRRVAIKTIKVENLSTAEAEEYEMRFRTEARSAARLQHPNIVSVYDSDRDVDIAYLVMEFVQGKDLKHFLDRGERFNLQQAAQIMNDLLAALDYAHRQNIVHRDVKPANLLIEASGRVKLTDFGVARIQDSGEATRTRGTMVGTLKYMSPEQVLGLPVDSRSDLFSAGVVLFQLLTGVRPFDGTSDYEVIQKIVDQPAPAPSMHNGALPETIDSVMFQALAKSRDDRFATARDFNVALQNAVANADMTITPPERDNSGFENSGWSGSLGAGAAYARTGRSGSSSSSVSQEAELVYWKDIKDSMEVEEFQNFLHRFPTGIYADLARRRIRRLTQGENSGSTPRASSGTNSGTNSGTRTRLTSAVDRSGTPDEATMKLDREGRVVAPGVAPEQQVSQFPATASGSPEEARQPDVEEEPDGSTDPTFAPTLVSVAPKTATPAAAREDARPSRRWLAWVAGGVVLAAAGAYWGLASGPAAPQGASTPGAEAPGQAASSALASASAPSDKSPVSGTPGTASESASAAAGEGGKAREAVAKNPAHPPVSDGAASSASKPVPKLAQKEIVPAATPASPVPVEHKAAETKPVATRAAPPAAAAPSEPADPRKECEGRILLGYLTCMQDQCEKAKYAQHPVCVERRSMEQRNRNSP